MSAGQTCDLLFWGLGAGSPRVRKVMYGWTYGSLNTQAFGHLLVQKALARAVRLHPFAINDKLRDGALAGAGDHLVRGAGRGFDINIFEWDVMSLQKALGDAAVRTPEGGIDDNFHRNFFAPFARFS